MPVVLGFVLLGCTAAGAIFLFVLQSNAVFWVGHTLAVEKTLDNVSNLVLRAEAAERGFALTRNPAFERVYQQAAQQLPVTIKQLRAQTLDNPSQLARIATLQTVVSAKLSDLEQRNSLVRAEHVDAAVRLLDRPSRNGTLRPTNRILGSMLDAESRLYADRVVRARRLTLATEIVLIGSLALVTLFAIWSLKEAQRRISTLAAANARLAEEMIERDAAEAQLRQLQKIESLGQLTGGIAHDFNNMLAVVIGSLDLGRRRLTGAEHPRLADAITNALEAAERAAVLTARLLAYSRRQPLEPKVIDANKLVGGMSELLRRTLGEMIRVETVLAGGLWRVRVDAAQLESAVLNLAVNARDAMPEGGRLTIETANTDLDDRYARLHGDVEPGQYVMVCVSDTGSGMAREVIDRAFDPFYTTKDVGRGTGLGLSQVHGFVKQSHGHVKIYSELGEGTTVKIYLPRHRGTEVNQAEHALSDDEPLPRGTPDCIILVVEDEDQVRRMTVDALRELGYTVIAARDATEALELLVIQPRIDLVFTDIVMPGMNGRELAEKALLLKPDTRVLYTTGYTRNAIVHNGTVDAGLALLTKPFSIETLARKIRAVLDS